MARLLRVERQLTVDQLAARLALPRSTVYYWVRDLPLHGGTDEAQPSQAREETGEAAGGSAARDAAGRRPIATIAPTPTALRTSPKLTRALSFEGRQFAALHPPARTPYHRNHSAALGIVPVRGTGSPHRPPPFPPTWTSPP